MGMIQPAGHPHEGRQIQLLQLGMAAVAWSQRSGSSPRKLEISRVQDHAPGRP